MKSPEVDAGRRSALLFVAAAGAAVAAGPLTRGVLPTDHLRLSRPTVTVDGHHVRLSTTVRGGARAGTRLRLWWVVVPVDVQRSPSLDQSRWTSPVTSAAFDPEGPAIVLGGSPSVPSGRYSVDLWLHAKRRTTFVHHHRQRLTVELG